MPRRVICNTSPLFYLFGIGKIDLLRLVYGEIVVPKEVIQELEEGAQIGLKVPSVDEYPWIRAVEVSIPSFLRMMPDLGKGEAAVTALSLKHKNVLCIIDDTLARKIASLRGCEYTGTLGILLASKRRGLIPEVKSFVEELKKSGFYMTEQLIQDVLEIAGEE